MGGSLLRVRSTTLCREEEEEEKKKRGRGEIEIGGGMEGWRCLSREAGRLVEGVTWQAGRQTHARRLSSGKLTSF